MLEPPIAPPPFFATPDQVRNYERLVDEQSRSALVLAYADASIIALGLIAIVLVGWLV